MPSRSCIVRCLFLHTNVINVLQPGVLNSPKSALSSSQVALKNLDMVCSWQASNAVPAHSAASHSSRAYSSATVQPVDNRLSCSMIHCGLRAQSVTWSRALYRLSPLQNLQ